jgi:hypothetical protein
VRAPRAHDGLRTSSGCAVSGLVQGRHPASASDRLDGCCGLSRGRGRGCPGLVSGLCKFGKQTLSLSGRHVQHRGSKRMKEFCCCLCCGPSPDCPGFDGDLWKSGERTGCQTEQTSPILAACSCGFRSTKRLLWYSRCTFSQSWPGISCVQDVLHL